MYTQGPYILCRFTCSSVSDVKHTYFKALRDKVLVSIIIIISCYVLDGWGGGGGGGEIWHNDREMLLSTIYCVWNISTTVGFLLVRTIYCICESYNSISVCGLA